MLPGVLCTSGFVDNVMFHTTLCVFLSGDSRNYCIDSNQILLNDKYQQVGYVSWAVRAGTKSAIHDCQIIASSHIAVYELNRRQSAGV